MADILRCVMTVAKRIEYPWIRILVDQLTWRIRVDCNYPDHATLPKATFDLDLGVEWMHIAIAQTSCLENTLVNQLCRLVFHR